MEDKNSNKDEYLDVSKYQNKPKAKDNSNFSAFEAEGEFYFAFLDKKGGVALRSEGYSSEKARDNGIESVKKNRKLEERWSIDGSNNKYYLALKAGNHQEIGRSGSFNSEADAKAYLAGLLGKSGSSSKPAAASGVTSSGGHSAGYAAALAASGIVPGRIISEKRGKIINTTRNQIGESRREIGVTRNQIGESRRELSQAKNLINTTKSKIEFMPCAAYHGHKVSDTKNNVALFEKAKKHYFAIYDKSGGVRLRGAGYPTTAQRDSVLADTLANIGNKKQYTTIKKDNYTMDSLKNKDGRELARTCLKGEAMIAPAGAIATMAALGAEAAPAAIPAASGIGFWPFLLLLPLLILPFMCSSPPIIVPPPPIPYVAPVVAAAPVCECASLTHPIFVIPDTPPPKATTMLGRAPEYGNSHSLDAAGFYNKLKNKYAASAMERTFLNGVFKQMGFENGFSDATAADFSEVEVPYGVEGNLGTKVTHKTVYRTLNTSKRDRQAFRISGRNACDLHFMKTCGNHFFYKGLCE